MGNAAGLSPKSPRFLSSRWGPSHSVSSNIGQPVLQIFQFIGLVMIGMPPLNCLRRDAEFAKRAAKKIGRIPKQQLRQPLQQRTAENKIERATEIYPACIPTATRRPHTGHRGNYPHDNHTGPMPPRLHRERTVASDMSSVPNRWGHRGWIAGGRRPSPKTA